MVGGFFHGTSIEQDQRFGDATQSLIKNTKFSRQLRKPVDMTKVNLDSIKPWVSRKIKELIGIEDEVLYEYVINMLEGEENNHPDPKTIQLNLTGFLENKTQQFMLDLWSILLEAQSSPTGIPESFVKDKIEEIKKRQEEEERIKKNINVASNGRRLRKSGKPSRWGSADSSGSTTVTATANDTYSEIKSKPYENSSHRIESENGSGRRESIRNTSRSNISNKGNRGITRSKSRDNSRSRSKSPKRSRDRR